MSKTAITKPGVFKTAGFFLCHKNQRTVLPKGSIEILMSWVASCSATIIVCEVYTEKRKGGA